jgi:hypothetical protein
MSDPLMQLLAELRSTVPDPALAERLRTRCHQRLVRPRPTMSVRNALAGRGAIAQLWQPLIGILAVAYLTEVIVQVLGVYSLR